MFGRALNTPLRMIKCIKLNMHKIGPHGPKHLAILLVTIFTIKKSEISDSKYSSIFMEEDMIS